MQYQAFPSFPPPPNPPPEMPCRVRLAAQGIWISLRQMEGTTTLWLVLERSPSPHVPRVPANLKQTVFWVATTLEASPRKPQKV
jgi:hypothetical protein